MKLPTENRKIEKKSGDKKKKTLRDLGLGDNTIHTRADRPTVQQYGDSNVACKWISGEFAQGTKYKDTIGKIQRILHSWWKRGAATPISNIDNFVKHVYREHNQEADHWADIELREEEKLISKEKTPQQHGKRYVVSGMEASKTMAGVAAES